MKTIQTFIEERSQKLGAEEGSSTPDAITYIRGSSICTDAKHEWLLPLIEKVLSDELDRDSVAAFVLGGGARKAALPNKAAPILKSVSVGVRPQDIQKISSIEKFSNVGLVDIDNPLKIEDGLNIFYGRNGSGKSSIYLGLCKLFGKEKPLQPNVDGTTDESECVIKYKDKEGKDGQLAWKTDEENIESRVMIFDGLISQTLVEDDQNNQFEIAHLKLEYFTFLRELYDSVESILDGASTNTDTAIADNESVLEDSVPDLMGLPPEEIKKAIAKNSFGKTEKDELRRLQKKLILLGKENPEAIVKNLRTAQSSIQGVLSAFGKMETSKWHFKYTNQEFFQPTNERIKKFNTAKKAFEKGGQSKIAAMVPGGWISDPSWNEFIQKGIEFVESLDEHSKHKYRDEICVYCQQKLVTPASRKLIKVYADITAEHEGKLKIEKKALGRIADSIFPHIEKLRGIADINALIESEFSLVGKKGKIAVDGKKVVRILEEIKKSIENLSEIKISDNNYQTLAKFYGEYVTLAALFRGKAQELEKSISSKNTFMAALERKIAPLQEAKSISANKKALKNYLAHLNKKEVMETKMTSVHSLKQSTSRLESEFAKIAGLKEFKLCLAQEYKQLHFIAPPSWSLKPTTRDGVNKRTYSLNDWRLADIFSEGERKLHSLADFFAQCEINKYRGIYIFDDPVNSLDEANIECVARRILKLAADGNQVIVFTHNLYFLNELDTSSQKKMYQLTKTRGQIVIEYASIESNGSLKARMKIVDAKMTELAKLQTPTREQIGGVYDLMSGYIESYVEKVLFNNVVSRYRSNVRMNALAALPDISKEKIRGISTLYEHTSRRGTRHSQPGEIPEATYDQLTTDYKLLKTDFNYS